MKNLPIGMKLGIGFGIVLIMLLASSGMAYYYITSNLESFTQYRGLAKDTNLMGRVQANMLMVRMNVKDFLITDAKKDLDEFDEYYSSAKNFLDTAQNDIQQPERASLVQRASELMTGYNSEFGRVKKLQSEQRPRIDILNTKGPEIEELLTSLMRSADENGDTATAFHAGLALRDLLLARLHVVKFLNDNSEASKDAVLAELKNFDTERRYLDDQIRDPEQRRMVREAEQLTLEYEKAFVHTAKLIADRNAIVKTKLNVWGPQMAAHLEDAKLSVKAAQDELGPKVQKQSEQAGEIVSILTIGASAFGLLAAVFITLAITRPMKRITRFAESVAHGDFDHTLDINQKDEVGVLAEAVGAVPATLNRFRTELSGTADKISLGHVRSRGDSTEFPGSYGELLNDVNELADALTGFLDAAPTPIMAVDNAFNITFMNTAGAKAGGKTPRDVEGGKCSRFFKTGDCNTANCACARAMRTGAEADSSTDAHPGSQDMEISYTGVPIFDRSGKTAGALEVVLDQTDIIRAQRRMTDVAGRAEEISHRLSAAAEELSAQVQQVSRGSEIQRDRVNETATAMEEMNATVLEVAQNASNASSDTGEARDRAHDGARVVKQAVSAISEVHTSAKELQVNMKQLEKQAESIGQVMNVISDIADQTNLLALNAAIEAARAGEAGRGFAVVADEVRKLAEKTMGATQEVGASISAIQQAAKVNIDSMNSAAETVELATGLANDSGDSLTAIVDLVSNSAGQVEGIAAASEEQSAASEEITNSIEEINRIVTETTEGMTQSAIAVQEVATMSSQITVLINELQEGKDNA